MFQSEDVSRTRALLGESRDETPEVENEQRSEEGPKTPFFRIFPKELFVFAGLKDGVRKKYLFLLCIALVIGALLAAASGVVYFFALPVAVYFIQNQVLESKIQARQADFDKDYAALLLSLASGLKTGLDPLMALCRSGELFQPESVLRKELEAFQAGLDEGATEDEAIDRLGSSVRHPDIKLFRMAFKLARKEGSSLSLCLQRLARVTRQRQSFRRKTKGAVAMQKLSAFGIAGCSVFIGVVQGGSNAQAFIEAFAHPLGRTVIVLGIGLIVTGVIWMLQMSKLKI